MLGRQPGLQGRQRDVRMSLDMRPQRRLLRRCQLARAVAASRARRHLAGPASPDQRLVNVRHADLENRRRRASGHPSVNRRQNARPKII
jgi:hypothetical protein